MIPQAKDQNNSVFYRPELSNINPKAKFGKDCTIHSHVWIGGDVKIGDRVKIQAYTFIPDGVIIEDDVFIGPHVVFTNDPRMEMDRSKWAKTLVKAGAKIGANACIKAGVKIGERSIIGMGAVVTRDIPPNEIWVGNPATKLVQNIL